MSIDRRGFLWAPAALAACGRAEHDPARIEGRFAGASAERGHWLREPRLQRNPIRSRRAQVVIAGAGVAGLAAARALRRRGIEDFALLDLEDVPGGNSRPSELGGVPCPMGAHYLPVPGETARDVLDLLEELGLRKRVAGRWVIDERHQCHAPQERLYVQGQWQPGLLPLVGAGATTLAQYARCALAMERERQARRFRIPNQADARTRFRDLDAITFAQWLDREGLNDPQLLWYLDYCCRDDYGAGLRTVSAWAGLHYFASRHGFHAPGSDEAGEREAVLTWPEGNGWITRALARPVGDRFMGGRVVLRIAAGRHGVEVDARDAATGALERWQAAQCIVALPAFVAARVVENPPAALLAQARQARYAPWLVVNLHLHAPPKPTPGAPLAWDNVIYGTSGSLGYVVATHQRLDPTPGPTVLSWYCAPGEDARGELLQRPWEHWRDRALRELSVPHRDLPQLVTQVEVARYGHAMPIPVPGTLARLNPPPDSARLRYAHADWAGYSIFEEAFTLGHRAGARP